MVYSPFDFAQLSRLYFDHSWLRNEVNKVGFENLWFEQDSEERKLVIVNLLNSFKYAHTLDVENVVVDCFRKWVKEFGLTPQNTIFLAVRMHKNADGSNALLQFMRGPMEGLFMEWKDFNFVGYFYDGLRYLRAGGLRSDGLVLQNLVLVDDFVGTGKTISKRIVEIQQIKEELSLNTNVFFFGLAGMLAGKRRIMNLKIPVYFGYTMKKGTSSAYHPSERLEKRKLIVKMEEVLAEEVGEKKLKQHSLGWGRSESLFSWTRFNIPNNVYPIFWWNRKNDGKERRTMFNRMQ